MKTVKDLQKELNKLKILDKAKVLQSFFKTGKGDYGEGDIFLGISMKDQRILASEYNNLDIQEVDTLIKSKIHEYRMTGLLILVCQYENCDEKVKKKIYNYFIKNAQYINNWDLVDATVPKVVGHYLLNRDKKVLYKFANSNNLWKKRISIVSTYTFIRNNQFNDTMKIAQILLKDSHDLIHKSVGWMLREVGKRDERVLKFFLDKHYFEMPRTMLRYSIEKFIEKERKYYLKKR